MIREIRWRRRRWIAPLLSAVVPGLGQALTARWSSAILFFGFAVIPIFFMTFIRRELNFGHYIMFPLLGIAWILNIIDAFRGSPGPMAPCIEACPANIHIPRYIQLVVEGRYQECHALISRWTPLVGVVGHVCHHPCETACTRLAFDQPVAICPLKAAVGAHMIEHDLLRHIPAPVIREGAPRVAIIGSGPAGLTAAFVLARLGLRPTIFERLKVAGGMLAVGIPSYRLPRTVLAAEIDFVLRQGVELRTGVNVGTDLTVANLFEQGFQAVLAASGTHREARLRIEGEEKEGVLPGLSFLSRANLGEINFLEGDVVVVGGGNVAMDAARSALRLGASTVTVVYRRSRREMPANEWEVTEAEEEGVRFLLLTNPARILGEEAVSGVECLQMKLGEPDASGRRAPVPVPGSEFVLPCRWIIPAIGLGPDTGYLEGSGARLGKSGLVFSRRGRRETHRPNLFAGGDVVSGPASVIAACAHGRQAALEIASRLGYRGEDWGAAQLGPAASEFATRGRVPQRSRPAAERCHDFRLIHQLYKDDESRSEGRRCLRCDLPM